MFTVNKTFFDAFQTYYIALYHQADDREQYMLHNRTKAKMYSKANEPHREATAAPTTYKLNKKGGKMSPTHAWK